MKTRLRLCLQLLPPTAPFCAALPSYTVDFNLFFLQAQAV